MRRTTLQASIGGSLYLLLGVFLIRRAALLQLWGIHMAGKYPRLYASASFQHWLKSPAYVPAVQLIGALALGIAGLLFYIAYSLTKD